MWILRQKFLYCHESRLRVILVKSRRDSLWKKLKNGHRRMNIKITVIKSQMKMRNVSLESTVKVILVMKRSRTLLKYAHDQRLQNVLLINLGYLMKDINNKIFNNQVGLL